MIEAELLGPGQARRRAGDVLDPGRRPEALAIGPHGLARLQAPQDRRREVTAPVPVEATHPDDEDPVGRGGRQALTGQLRARVDPLRRRRIELVVGPLALAVEDEVGRVVDELGADALDRSPQDLGRERVRAVREVRFVLGAVHVGVGARVEGDVGAQPVEDPGHGRRVGDVAVGSSERGDLPGARFLGGQERAEGLSERPVGAEDDGLALPCVHGVHGVHGVVPSLRV